MGVIGPFEAVQIDHQQTRWRSVATGTGELAAGGVVPPLGVEQTSLGIGAGAASRSWHIKTLPCNSRLTPMTGAAITGRSAAPPYLLRSS